jgi:membrane protease YdiL (CAAX protease family)
LFVLRTAVLIPIAEEVVFRFLLLRSLVTLSGSPTVANVGSALVFSTVHLGPSRLGNGSAQELLNGFWLFCGSLLLGRLVFASNGRIVTAIVLHSARNFIEAGLLLLYTWGALHAARP